MNRMVRCLAIVFAASIAPSLSSACPQKVQAADAEVIVYQPQPESLKADRLTGRAAFSWKDKSTTEPALGALWFDARLETDREARTAAVTDLRITRVRVPSVEEEREREISSQLQGAAARTDRSTPSPRRSN